MNQLDSNLSAIVETMLNNRLRNYIVPGLDSSLVGGGEHGKVRMFEASRNTRDSITPHNHRFDFGCIVLAGEVQNTLYIPDSEGSAWCRSTIDQVCGADGVRDFVHTREDQPRRYSQSCAVYSAGQTYTMGSEEIHSIVFSRGAQVLFLEGPSKTTRSVMIEPWIDGRCIPTFEVKEWMFQQEAGH
jgi:hypothetical protein